MGRKIIDDLKTIPLVEVTDQPWWRARTPDGGRQFAKMDMFPPRRRLVRSEGRYNHYGQRVFYFARTKDAAAREVLHRGETLAWVQQFHVTVRGRILNLCYDDAAESCPPLLLYGLSYEGDLTRPSDPESPWKPEYFPSRFIADCARSQGLVGVMFRSGKHYSENLVLFEWNEELITAIEQPETIVISPLKNVDFIF
jgi:RES domain-containing protein